MELTIGITTFSKRFDMLSKLISQIRQINKKDKIIICVNGEKDGQFNDEYRKKILLLSSQYENVFPIFFIEMRGLSKMWNTIIVHSNCNNVLLLNDDIEINNMLFFSEIYNHLKLVKDSGITRINNSFSHFLINKPILDKIGYFDERLLGFGEEDGDIYYRFIKNNLKTSELLINGVLNIVSDTRHDHVKNGIGKYSKFNRDYVYLQKYEVDTTSPLKGMFDSPMKQIISDVNCYPFESFYFKNKDKL